MRAAHQQQRAQGDAGKATVVGQQLAERLIEIGELAFGQCPIDQGADQALGHGERVEAGLSIGTGRIALEFEPAGVGHEERLAALVAECCREIGRQRPGGGGFDDTEVAWRLCPLDRGEVARGRPGERRHALGNQLRQVGRIGQGGRHGTCQHERQNDQQSAHRNPPRTRSRWLAGTDGGNAAVAHRLTGRATSRIQQLC